MTAPNPYNVAVIFLHPACNMRCTFCITEDNFDAMTQAQASGLLRTLKDEKFNSVVLGGGEPFEWPGDLIALTKEAKQMGFIVQIGTNAIALPDKFEKIESIDRYVLPLESVDSRVHNQMRLYKDRHHELIIGALTKLAATGKSVTVSTIITQVNKDGLKALAQYLKEINATSKAVHAWHLYKFLPLGRGGKAHAEELNISDEDYSKACDEAKAVGLSFPVYRRRNMYRSRTVDFFWYEHGKLQRGSADKSADPVARMTVPFADS